MTDTPLDLVLSHLDNVRKRPDGQYQALCPAHDDSQPSLSVGLGDDGRVLLNCFARCTVQSIVDALGLTMSDLIPGPRRERSGSQAWREVAAYDYRDAEGGLLFQVVRRENTTDKTFAQRRPDGEGGFVYNLDGIERVLYRLPELNRSDPRFPVLVVESEKDVDRLVSLNIVATCSPHGAGKWARYQDQYNKHLRDRCVVIIPDNDEPGRMHANQVIDSIRNVAAEVRVLELPNLADKGDVSDWLDSGGDPTDLLSMAQDAPVACEWVRSQQNEPQAHLESGGWKWRTLADALQDDEPVEYLVKGLLRLASFTILFGPPGALKTMLVLDLALCVASGRSWLTPLRDDQEGTQAYEVLQTSVLLIDIDNGRRRISNRLAALSRGLDVPAGAPLAYVCFPDDPPFVASRPEPVQAVIRAATRTGAKLIIIDNLLAVSGGANENSSEMGPVMLGLRQLVETTGAAVLVLHHPSKDKRWIRGFSGIEGALDLTLEVTREGHENKIDIRSVKVRDLPIEPFSALWTCEQDERGELIKGRFYGLGRPEQVKLSKQEQAELCIMRDMEDGMNQTQLVNLVKDNAGIGRHTAIAAVQSLAGQKRLHARDGDWPGSIEYSRVG
jgi:putative DNA primase/helicase